MFTGIVERTALVASNDPVPGGSRLVLRLAETAAELQIGESVAVNGCCLTVVAADPGGLVHFDLLQETLRVTNLGTLKAGSCANIERALRVTDRLSGHFVQGHVDACAPILALEPSGQDYSLDIALPPALARYTILKGSITVDGMSLTIAALEADRFRIWITPHTFTITNLATRKPGELVNLEADLLAKYLERLFANPDRAGT